MGGVRGMSRSQPLWCQAGVVSAKQGDATEEPVLTGAWVRLRGWGHADLDVIHRACQDPDIQRWTRVPSPYVEGSAHGFVDHVVPATRAQGGASFAVETAEGVVGSIALHHAWDGVGEIGFWMAPWARGRGLLHDALITLCRWCFEERGLARVEMLIEPDNHASRRVAVRAGFSEEGTLRRRLLLRGHRHDVVMYALLDDER